MSARSITAPKVGSPVTFAAVALFAQDRFDARVAKRIQALRDRGWAVTGFTFHRPRPNCGKPTLWENIELGETRDRAYGHRLISLIFALPRIARHRARIASAHSLYAINFDNALLALAARFMARSTAPLVVEIADIQPPMMRRGILFRLMRACERRVLRACRCLVTTSPGFVREYFTSVQRYSGRVFLLENKVYPAGVLLRHRTAPTPSGPPWTIGYFGALRCRRSWEIIKAVARALPEIVRFRLRGFPSAIDPAQFHEEVAGFRNIEFGGPYRYPDELPGLYEGLHFNWCFDFHDQTNSKWLLPNRLYEGGLFHIPALASRDSETGSWIARHNAGWVFGDDLATELVAFLGSLMPSDWSARQNECARLPDKTFAGESDYDRLSAMLEALD